MGDVEDPVLATKRVYEEIAPAFLESTRNRSLSNAVLAAFALAVGSGARVLDAGAGPGFDSVRLAEAGLRPIALDLSRAMLAVARDEFPAPRVQCDLRMLSLRDDCCKGVWANASLLHLPVADMARALVEIRRVLAPLGYLHLSLKSGDSAGFETRSYDRPRWFTRWRAADLDALLERTGFDVVRKSVRTSKRDTWLVRLCQKSS